MIKAFNILPTTNKQFKFIISALDIVKKIEFSDVMSNRVQNCIFLFSKSMNKGCTKDIYISVSSCRVFFIIVTFEFRIVI